MFYRLVSDGNKSRQNTQDSEASAVVSLTPSESKRLIAKAVAKLLKSGGYRSGTRF